MCVYRLLSSYALCRRKRSGYTTNGMETKEGGGRGIRDKFRGIYYLDKWREFASGGSISNSALFIATRGLVRLDACKPCRQNVDQRSIRSCRVSLERIVARRSFPLRELFATHRVCLRWMDSIGFELNSDRITRFEGVDRVARTWNIPFLMYTDSLLVELKSCWYRLTDVEFVQLNFFHVPTEFIWKIFPICIVVELLVRAFYLLSNLYERYFYKQR